jgi:hypothetical protein
MSRLGLDFDRNINPYESASDNLGTRKLTAIMLKQPMMKSNQLETWGKSSQ